MGWRIVADATLVAHFGFIVFMVAGGLLTRRREWIAPIHLLVLAYGVTISTLGFRCPLTPMEQRFRRAAGEAGYDESFVEHYLLGLIYPGGIDATVRIVMVLGLVAVLAVSYRPWVMASRGPLRPPARPGSRRTITSRAGL